MAWYQENQCLESLKDSAVRNEWRESGCYDAFWDIEGEFPKDRRDKSRMGALEIKQVHGTDGLHCWMSPVEGYSKILGPENKIALYEVDGTLFFEGKWSETTHEMIQQRERFFIWLAPREGQQKMELSWKQKLQGFWRYLKHRKK